MKLTLTHNSLSVIHDPAFVNWIANPSKESDRYWQEFLIENPDKRVQIIEAGFIIRSLRRLEEQFDETEVKELWTKIVYETTMRQKRLLFLNRFFMVTAVVFIFSHSERILTTLLSRKN